jgi:hypothetical protein
MAEHRGERTVAELELQWGRSNGSEAACQNASGVREELLCLRSMGTGKHRPAQQGEEGEKVCTNDEWAPRE